MWIIKQFLNTQGKFERSKTQEANQLILYAMKNTEFWTQLLWAYGGNLNPKNVTNNMSNPVL